jgi:predicted component of type VI protein secretion system
MDYQLVIVRGRSAAQALQLADGVTTVGRHDDCQLRIKSSQVSRKHCELFEKKGLLLVKDLGSANGTYVNGEKVDGQRVLESGDELTIGGVKLRVERKGDSAAATATKPSDTAVTAAVADAETVPTAAGADDEFEIDFDSDAAGGADDLAFDLSPDATGGDADFDDLLNSPVPPVGPPAATPPPAAATPPPAPAAEQPEETPVGDDAVADFLLDIKFDDDDK